MYSSSISVTTDGLKEERKSCEEGEIEVQDRVVCICACVSVCMSQTETVKQSEMQKLKVK